MQWVADELRSSGSVRRRRLGVGATSHQLSRSLVREFDLLSHQAVRIVEVVSGSVAAEAGIEPGDIIITMNDRIVSSVDDIHRLLSLAPAATEFEIYFLRNDWSDRLTLSFTNE